MPGAVRRSWARDIASIGVIAVLAAACADPPPSQPAADTAPHVHVAQEPDGAAAQTGEVVVPAVEESPRLGVRDLGDGRFACRVLDDSYALPMIFAPDEGGDGATTCHCCPTKAVIVQTSDTTTEIIACPIPADGSDPVPRALRLTDLRSGVAGTDE